MSRTKCITRQSQVANLGAVNPFTGAQYAKPVTITSASGALAVDCDKHQEATCTLSENTTVSAPTNGVAGKYITINIIGASTYTLSWNAAFKANATTALPTAPGAGKQLSVCFRCKDANTFNLVGFHKEG